MLTLDQRATWRLLLEGSHPSLQLHLLSAQTWLQKAVPRTGFLCSDELQGRLLAALACLCQGYSSSLHHSQLFHLDCPAVFFLLCLLPLLLGSANFLGTYFWFSVTWCCYSAAPHSAPLFLCPPSPPMAGCSVLAPPTLALPGKPHLRHLHSPLLLSPRLQSNWPCQRRGGRATLQL